MRDGSEKQLTEGDKANGENEQVATLHKSGEVVGKEDGKGAGGARSWMCLRKEKLGWKRREDVLL